jgi:FkbM family methyltransferase
MDRAALRRAGRTALRDALARAGLELRRTGGGGPRRTLAEVLAHARSVGVAPRTVVDVGVAAGTPELYAAFPDAALLLVEPLADLHRAELDALAARRRTVVAPVAAGPEPGAREIAVHRVPACSSLLGGRVGEGGHVARRSVPVARLDDLLEQHGLAGPHVLKVDVEGAELDVLAGAPRALADAELVLLEVSFFALVPGGAQVADVVCWMRDRGFAPYDVFSGHVRPLDGALAQLDVAFVPADGPLRADHRYATAEQADALYRRWGL